MSRVTFLRVAADSDVVERVLGLTPGVEVVETLDGERDDTPSASSLEGPSDGQGDRPSGETLGEGSTVREYGLLGVGIAFVTLGIATVGIWWYRRRSGDESSEGPTEGSGDVETPPPATEFESPSKPTTAAADTGGGPGDGDTDDETDEGADDGTETEELNLVLDSDKEEGRTEAEIDDDSQTDEAGTGDGDTDAGLASRTEERDDVEWEPKLSGSPPEPSPDTGDDESADDGAEDADEPRAGDSVDAAPLLGIAFITITGALVRWAKDGSDPDET